ncbi:MAG: hypothetical protein Q8P84_08555 [Deltaproteobacteria bacterium]|nr:hypothetical protein [Deltaproteobacteria bacterium]
MSRIQFGNMRLATPLEQQQFLKLDIAKKEDTGKTSTFPITHYGLKIKNGKNDLLISCVEFVADKRFQCNVTDIINSGDIEELAKSRSGSIWITDLNLSPVKEVRGGDIDGDGDIDIATKLNDGGIYVFHQN